MDCVFIVAYVGKKKHVYLTQGYLTLKGDVESSIPFALSDDPGPDMLLRRGERSPGGSATNKCSKSAFHSFNHSSLVETRKLSLLLLRP